MTVRDIADRLPSIKKLRRRCLAVATLDAILSPTWDNRYYSFNHDWGDGDSCAQMHNGCGDDCFIVFTPAGVFIRGFNHESSLSPFRSSTEESPAPPSLWPGLVDSVPKVFTPFLSEPAFSIDDEFACTYCLWRKRDKGKWNTAPQNSIAPDAPDIWDGSDDFLELLTDSSTQSYIDFARDYFEVELPAQAVAHIYELRPLSEEVVQALNPKVHLAELSTDLAASHYPT